MSSPSKQSNSLKRIGNNNSKAMTIDTFSSKMAKSRSKLGSKQNSRANSPKSGFNSQNGDDDLQGLGSLS